MSNDELYILFKQKKVIDNDLHILFEQKRSKTSRGHAVGFQGATTLFYNIFVFYAIYAI